MHSLPEESNPCKLKINIAIVAHHARKEQALALAEQVQADHVSMDMGDRGAGKNHRDAWTWHQHHLSDWAVTLEDDALPCKDFRGELEKALTVAPTHLVSLYLGKLKPESWQSTIASALSRADKEKANWIVSKYNLHAVGIACHMPLVRALSYALSLYSIYPTDEAIALWCSRNAVDMAYTVPSLVDHADWPTLIEHIDGQDREPGRVAWRVGTRRKWSDVSVPFIGPMSARVSPELVTAAAQTSNPDTSSSPGQTDLLGL